MRKFPRLLVTLTLDKSFKCHHCPTVIPPFSAAYILAKSIEKENVGTLLCGDCLKKEVETRANILREDMARPIG